MIEKRRIFLDDLRTPIDKTWIVLRNYTEFVNDIDKNGLSDEYSLDHDLGYEHYRLSMYDDDEQYNKYYNTFEEKTGYDCAKYLVQYCIDNNLNMPILNVHSLNPIGSKNIITLINNFYKETNSSFTCTKNFINHIVNDE